MPRVLVVKYRAAKAGLKVGSTSASKEWLDLSDKELADLQAYAKEKKSNPILKVQGQTKVAEPEKPKRKATKKAAKVEAVIEDST